MREPLGDYYLNRTMREPLGDYYLNGTMREPLGDYYLSRMMKESWTSSTSKGKDFYLLIVLS